jgi:hypothetical protein
MDVIINDKEIDVPMDLATWGELLDWIETSHLKAGQCITHVHLDGDETYNYRDRLLCNRELDEIGQVAVRTGDFDTVVNESMEELDRELGNALVAARDIVQRLEKREEDQAYIKLVQLLESIRIFFTIFSEDLGWVESDNAEVSRKDFSPVLERALSQLVGAQENRNWVSVCDVLEYEITPILESWHGMVARTREHIHG